VDTSSKAANSIVDFPSANICARAQAHLLSPPPFCLVNATAIAVSHAISRIETSPPRRSPASLTVDLGQTPNPKDV
jgi:hypothetical protein